MHKSLIQADEGSFLEEVLLGQAPVCKQEASASSERRTASAKAQVGALAC